MLPPERAIDARPPGGGAQQHPLDAVARLVGERRHVLHHDHPRLGHRGALDRARSKARSRRWISSSPASSRARPWSGRGRVRLRTVPSVSVTVTVAASRPGSRSTHEPPGGGPRDLHGQHALGRVLAGPQLDRRLRAEVVPQPAGHQQRPGVGGRRGVDDRDLGAAAEGLEGLAVEHLDDQLAPRRDRRPGQVGDGRPVLARQPLGQGLDRGRTASRPRPASVTTRSASGQQPGQRPARRRRPPEDRRQLRAQERPAGAGHPVVRVPVDRQLHQLQGQGGGVAGQPAARADGRVEPAALAGLGDQDRARGLVVGEPLDDLPHGVEHRRARARRRPGSAPPRASRARRRPGAGAARRAGRRPPRSSRRARPSRRPRSQAPPLPPVALHQGVGLVRPPGPGLVVVRVGRVASPRAGSAGRRSPTPAPPRPSA